MLAGVFGVLYGTIDEYHQSYIPGRMAEFLDAFADAAGAFAGAAMYVAFLALLARRHGSDLQQGRPLPLGIVHQPVELGHLA